MGDIRGALETAYRRQSGRAMPEGMAEVLSAHVAHETARGERMFNFNFGGIKGKSPSGTTARYLTTEVLDGKHKKLVDGFRAYPNATEGAEDYLALLGDRYPQALAQAQRGDVTGFAAALKQQRYFTADLADYTRALHAHASEAAATGTRGRAQGTSYLFGHELAREGLRLDGVQDAALPTSLEVARVMGVMSSLAARIGAPIADDGPTPTARRTG
ncbi:MAG: hypothetical protein EXR75_00180 [Myxococcales bacterium]|nr:hypothetical protein [Myxococcales bacterium]